MYQHTQKSPLHFLLYLVAVFMFLFAWQIRDDAAPSIVLVIVAVVLTVLALSFQTLTISDQQSHLSIQYGPLNLFGTRIPYAQITSAEPGTTSIIDGWGIHWIPFRGWTINLWGFECVKLQMGDRVLRIGTDDSTGLVQLLQQRMNDQSAESAVGAP